MTKFLSVFILFFVVSSNVMVAYAPKNIKASTFKAVKKKYGKKGAVRVQKWDKLIEKAKKEKKLVKKLKLVNDFFNKAIKYRTDIKLWKKKDYWATPFETMGRGAGDCEDYAIAKYFTLRKLGIPDKKLRITYVSLRSKRSKFDQAHMVLTFYNKPTSVPIVLDNVNRKLKLASKRKDLIPVYSFNATGLWKAKNKGKSSGKKKKNNLRSWKDLMTRI
jgi:predicted transglutaminase-like cysteine proteinase